ncbi:hypothetical protein EV426DRAFT_288333 [Tirmania nivea]|nr:hypothetical protein EV426DRAFT_288333 [Tirmania nivea]
MSPSPAPAITLQGISTTPNNTTTPNNPTLSGMPPPPTQSLPPPTSATAKSTWITHRYQQDNVFPRLGQLVKVRLDQPLSGPGSSHVSSHAPTSATPKNYHSAVVLSVYNDARLRHMVLTVFPIPAYTGARFDGIESETWVAQQAVERRRKHIPMPFIGGNDDQYTHTIPEGFGEPVRPVYADGSRYLDRVPSWIFTEVHFVHLPWATIWKSFHPDVSFTTPDIQRLQAWDTHLQVLSMNSNPNNNLTVNMLHIPEDYTHPRGVFEELFAEVQGVVHYLSEDEEIEVGALEEEEDAPRVGSMLELVRMIGTADEATMRWVAEEDERINGEREEWIEEWLADT